MPRPKRSLLLAYKIVRTCDHVNFIVGLIMMFTKKVIESLFVSDTGRNKPSTEDATVTTLSKSKRKKLKTSIT